MKERLRERGTDDSLCNFSFSVRDHLKKKREGFKKRKRKTLLKREKERKNERKRERKTER